MMSPNIDNGSDLVNEATVQPNGADAVIATALAQLGKPYKLGTEGPSTFDCSGLVWFCFNLNGLASLIGGARHRANWYYNWFKSQNRFSSNVALAVAGDLIVYGSPDSVTHIGIYRGDGIRRPLVSALTNPFGVSKTRINGLEHTDGSKLPIVGVCKVQYSQNG
jgi:cell wall-associated NlpC family hydrolase